jgi:cytoskeletal protein RodZ
MFRKIIALLLLALLICLPACGAQQSDDTQTIPTTQSDPQAADPSVSESQEEQEPTEEDTTLPPEEEGWISAAPSGSAEPTEPQQSGETTEPDNQEETQTSDSEGVPEDYTPWG